MSNNFVADFEKFTESQQKENNAQNELLSFLFDRIIKNEAAIEIFKRENDRVRKNAGIKDDKLKEYQTYIADKIDEEYKARIFQLKNSASTHFSSQSRQEILAIIK